LPGTARRPPRSWCAARLPRRPPPARGPSLGRQRPRAGERPRACGDPRHRRHHRTRLPSRATVRARAPATGELGPRRALPRGARAPAHRAGAGGIGDAGRGRHAAGNQPDHAVAEAEALLPRERRVRGIVLGPGRVTPAPMSGAVVSVFLWSVVVVAYA